MDLQQYRDEARQTAQRIGPGLVRIFAVYVGVLAVLNLLSYFLQNPMYDWYDLVRQYVAAGNFDLPLPPDRARIGFWLSNLLSLLGKVVTAGWVGVTLRSVRGGEVTWHDLWGAFSYFWKVIVIAVAGAFGCALGLCLLVFPGVYLFYGWRLSLFVLAEHPDYGPIRCMRQSRRLMAGERWNLFRLDLSCVLLYGLALLVFYFSSGILLLWRMPTLMILYCLFYNRMVYWRSPEEPGGAAGGEGPDPG